MVKGVTVVLTRWLHRLLTAGIRDDTRLKVIRKALEPGLVHQSL